MTRQAFFLLLTCLFIGVGRGSALSTYVRGKVGEQNSPYGTDEVSNLEYDDGNNVAETMAKLNGKWSSGKTPQENKEELKQEIAEKKKTLEDDLAEMKKEIEEGTSTPCGSNLG